MRRFLPPLVAIAALALPAGASANAFQDLFREYQRTGTINGCKHTAKQLTQAKRQVPNDIEQYAPDFPAALDAAAAQRATGACKKSAKKQAVAPVPVPGGATPAAPAQPGTAAPKAATPSGSGTGTPQPAAADQPAAAAADSAIPGAVQAASTDEGADDTPAPLILLAILGALLLLAAAIWSASRWWAWEPAWLSRYKHAGAEAGWRTSASWAEFRDWLRFGR